MTAPELNLKELITEGLIVDGAHHKQWYLERILEVLGFDVDNIRQTLEAEGYFAERGIAP